MNLRVPAGYSRIEEPGATIVGRDDLVDALREAYRAAPAGHRTIHGVASCVPGARRFEGREPAYVMTLPGISRHFVVRHNRHGGALRHITGDLFAGATRAPMELEISLRLKRLGVPTPPIVAFGIYPAIPGFARSDVLTEEIEDSVDLGTALLASEPGSAERAGLWGAVTRLLHRLAAAGVRHHDLNVKNILIRNVDGNRAGYVLDVDRIEFDCTRRDAFAGNRARLRRSVDKWRRLKGLRVAEGEGAVLRSSADR
jgi:tRNA A-37 threonylcarbamoyl transferase component Bud32